MTARGCRGGSRVSWQGDRLDHPVGDEWVADDCHWPHWLRGRRLRRVDGGATVDSKRAPPWPTARGDGPGPSAVAGHQSAQRAGGGLERVKFEEIEPLSVRDGHRRRSTTAPPQHLPAHGPAEGGAAEDAPQCTARRRCTYCTLSSATSSGVSTIYLQRPVWGSQNHGDRPPIPAHL